MKRYWMVLFLMFFLLPAESKELDVDKPLPRAPKRKVEQTLLHKNLIKSIERAQEFLLSQQQDDGQWGMHNNGKSGPTTLAALALVKSGISNRSPEIEKVVDWLMKNDRIPREVYSSGPLLMFLESYGKIYRKGALPKGINIFPSTYGDGKKKGKVKNAWTFDPKIKSWMEEVANNIHDAGSQWGVQWEIPINSVPAYTPTRSTP